MEKSKILEVVIGQIQQIGFDKEVEIGLKTKLSDDLGMDSLDAMDIITRVESEFKIEISDDAATDCESVEDLVNVIAEKV